MCSLFSERAKLGRLDSMLCAQQGQACAYARCQQVLIAEALQSHGIPSALWSSGTVGLRRAAWMAPACGTGCRYEGQAQRALCTELYRHAVQGAAISVSNSSDVEVRDNVIVHSPEHDGGHSAIQLEVVSEVRT